jgi:hypothetical protein
MTEETNFFLENQKRVMAQKAILGEAADTKTIPVGVVEDQATEPIFASRPGDPAPQVRKPFVPTTSPMPTKIVKPAALSLKQVKEGLVETGNDIDAAREKFTSDTASLDSYYSEQAALRLEIAQLQEQLAQKQARLHELENAGTPRDSFASSVVSLERQVTGYAGALLETLSEGAAQRIYGIPFSELSKDSQKDAQARYRKTLARFQSNFYLRIGRTHAQATADQLEQRAVEMLEDLSAVLDEHFPQEN